MAKPILTSLLFCIAAAVPALADVIYLADGTTITADKRMNIVNESMRRITYQEVGRDGKTEYKDIWEVSGYNMSRVRDEVAFEDAWNAAAKAGRQGKWSNVVDLVDTAFSLEPKQRYDRASMEMRLLYYKLRALAEDDPNDLFEDTWDDYVRKNLAYASREENTERNFTKTSMNSGPFKSANLIALHALTPDALSARGMYYAKKGEYDMAFEEGYQVVADLCFEIGRTMRTNDYIERYSVPAMEAAAAMFTSAATPDNDNAIELLRNAKDAWTRVEELQLAVRNLVQQDAARIQGAKCSIAIAEIYAAEGNDSSMRTELKEARDVLERQVEDFEKSARSKRPVDDEWLTESKASALSGAYTALGYASTVEGKLTDALLKYSRAIALFSANKEKRAEALLGAARVCLKLAESAAKKDYYIGVAERYQVELEGTLGDTAVGKEARDLADEIKAAAGSASE